MRPVVAVCRLNSDDDGRRVMIASVDTSRPVLMVKYRDGRVGLASELADYTYVRLGEVEPPV